MEMFRLLVGTGAFAHGSTPKSPFRVEIKDQNDCYDSKIIKTKTLVIFKLTDRQKVVCVHWNTIMLKYHPFDEIPVRAGGENYQNRVWY